MYNKQTIPSHVADCLYDKHSLGYLATDISLQLWPLCNTQKHIIFSIIYIYI